MRQLVRQQLQGKQLEEPHLVKVISGARKGSRICPTGEAIRLVGNENKLMVVHFLLDRPMRFSELQKLGLDSKTLSRILKGLEKNGLVDRSVVSTRPFAVQYSLTEMGMDLKPAIDSFWTWANKWIV
jgi:DNA-binding HxlR family transcriptional regulator